MIAIICTIFAISVNGHGMLLHVTTVPSPPIAGSQTLLKFNMLDADHKELSISVDSLLIAHERLVHVFILGDDFSTVSFLSPEDDAQYNPTSPLQLKFTFPRSGNYLIGITVRANMSHHYLDTEFDEEFPVEDMHGHADIIVSGKPEMKSQNPYIGNITQSFSLMDLNDVRMANGMTIVEQGMPGIKVSFTPNHGKIITPGDCYPLQFDFYDNTDGSPLDALHPAKGTDIHVFIIHEFQRFQHRYAEALPDNRTLLPPPQCEYAEVMDLTDRVQSNVAFGPSVLAYAEAFFDGDYFAIPYGNINNTGPFFFGVFKYQAQFPVHPTSSPTKLSPTSSSISSSSSDISPTSSPILTDSAILQNKINLYCHILGIFVVILNAL